MKHVIALILSIPQSLMAGFVFSHMWNWFLLRKFESLPRLTTLDAVGILMVVGFPLVGVYMMNARKEIKEKNPDSTDGGISIAVSLITTLLLYPCMLAAAALWHLVIG